MKLDSTFMSFLLEHQRRHNRTLNFVILMESIVSAARYIQHYYDIGAISDNLGEANQKNVQEEDVMHMDLIANQIVMHYLSESKQVLEATSEELSDEVLLSEDGRYIVYFDPLDGSSNIKHSLPVGFLFAIARRNLSGQEDYHLRTGNEFIAAGMFLIPSGIFTFALKDSGAWRFIKDEADVYVRPKQIKFPTTQKTWELSLNVGNTHTFSKPIQKWIGENLPKYAFRYAGALATDFHRLLNNGGMFTYPAIVNHPIPGKNRPNGKLRLIYECAVCAFIAKEAGGMAIDEHGDDILSIPPVHRHQRSALYVGNTEIIKDVQKVLKMKKEEMKEG